MAYGFPATLSDFAKAVKIPSREIGRFFRFYAGSALVAIIWRVGLLFVMRRRCLGITIGSLSPDLEEGWTVDTLESGLRMVQDLAPAKFSRVQRTIRLIVGVRSFDAYNHFQIGKICAIDLCKVHGLREDDYKYAVALVLARVALSGYLYERMRCHYHAANREVMIRLCLKQEQLLMRRMPRDVRDRLYAMSWG